MLEFDRGSNGLYQMQVKKLFLAKPGHELWELDYSQIELRIAAIYANVKWMIDGYKEGLDLHAKTATDIDAYSYFPDRPSEGRQIGKMGNFLWCYDGGGLRLRESLWAQARMDIPLTQCDEWTRRFREQTPNFKRSSVRAKRTADQRGYVLLWNGRRRRFVSGEDTRKAWNSIVQGGAGQILMRAMNEISRAYRAGIHSFEMCNTVHDALWGHVPIGDKHSIDYVESVMVRVATEAFEGTMPFAVDRKQLA